LSYLLEGKLTKDLNLMKRWMFEKPQVVHQWLDRIATLTGHYLDAQVNAGADAVQLFDTWAGMLGPEDYETFALPYARKTLSLVTAPSIYYVNGVSGILDQAASVGAQCLSVDWRMNLSEARRRIPQVMAIQGNLDPLALHLPKGLLRDRVLKMCMAYGTGPGHIVNLGHGIVPSVPEDSVKILIEATREFQLKA
jgi:uroporphyrinogen decarboxylase